MLDVFVDCPCEKELIPEIPERWLCLREGESPVKDHRRTNESIVSSVQLDAKAMSFGRTPGATISHPGALAH
ncbi:hypothetical protein ZHAS_00017609 [Anopheles sinensis]|uniref:Uncharacterized protein n=1 Tax=Anopheles sinensis TaxID=74873 RepID=A0A084WHA2_ANOSI|nr:hypothetical protein ZHAS_00017609 [Anopheles sinensis]